MGSIPITRSIAPLAVESSTTDIRDRDLVSGFLKGAHVAQLVEHVLGKDEVTSSILVNGSDEKESRLIRFVDMFFEKRGRRFSAVL